MRKQIAKIHILLIVLICLGTKLQGQDHFASTGRIAQFKLGMNLEQMEAIIERKISTDEAKLVSENYEKWISATWNGILFQFGFDYEYEENPLADKKFHLSRVKCSDARIKTKSGISIGMHKLEVFRILDEQKIDYTYSKFAELDEGGKKNGKYYETLTVTDDAGKTLLFNFKDGNIISFVLEYGADGC
jgi:hypothetical protein